MSASITSTRSNKSDDARRDFDGFDPDEELRRLREALRTAQWRIAAELSANLDEYLSLGGALPVAWLGPTCMQCKGDVEARHAETVEKASRMSHEQRDTAIWGYVSVPPGDAA